MQNRPEVLPRANINFRISWGDSRFWGSDFEPSQGETQGAKKTDSEVIIHSSSSFSNPLSPFPSPPLFSSSTSTDLEINVA